MKAAEGSGDLGQGLEADEVNPTKVSLDQGQEANEVTRKSQVYHERQVRQMCALHVLNNLFQDPAAFSKAGLDAICQELSPTSWLNPHKSALGLGNYDVNVVMMALQKNGFKTVWFDKRRQVEDIDLSVVLGFILNVPSDVKLLGFVPTPFQSKHWVAIRSLPVTSSSNPVTSSETNGEDVSCYYNLDSKLNEPVKIGKANDLRQFLKSEMSSQDRELLIVVSETVESPFINQTR